MLYVIYINIGKVLVSLTTAKMFSVRTYRVSNTLYTINSLTLYKNSKA